ncbi:unnamed protein product [Caenorhabditis angaria]|uniref:c-SKI SMAD4-binding domain-containing protein n=1 Tax=Caenorhabditis angaria TaxID=860376 RepID=A0A9P1ID51_9PELO|nr:unnamed protein product [Caenorhabditis angaria]
MVDSADPFFRLLERPGASNINLANADTLVISGRRHTNHQENGVFMWLQMFNQKLPSICIGGEPSIPYEILKEIFKKVPEYEQESFSELIKTKNIHVQIASTTQIKMLQAQCEECRKIQSTQFSLIRRSDVERLVGSLRLESDRCSGEHDIWNHAERFRVAHFNFCDAYDDFLEDDDLIEDISKYGVCGWLYPSRAQMRCILCCQCLKPFTPGDFVLHHHVVEKVEGIVHHGLNSNSWPYMLQLMGPETSRENEMAWEKFRNMDDAEMTPTLKRRHEFAPAVSKDLMDFELLNPFAMPVKKQKIIDVVGDMEYDDEDEEDENFDRNRDIDNSKALAKSTTLDLLNNPLFHSLKDKLPALLFPPPIVAPIKLVDTPMAPPSKPFEFSSNIDLKSLFPAPKLDLSNFAGLATGLPGLPVPQSLPATAQSLPGAPQGLVVPQGLPGTSTQAAQPFPLPNAMPNLFKFDPGWEAVKREQQILKSLPDEMIRLLDNKTIDVSLVFQLLQHSK